MRELHFPRGGNMRFLNDVKEDKKWSGLREDDAEDSFRWGLIISCYPPWQDETDLTFTLHWLHPQLFVTRRVERWFVALCGICSRLPFSVVSNSLSRLMVSAPPSLFSPPHSSLLPPSTSPPLLCLPPLAVCGPSCPFFVSSFPFLKRLLEHKAKTSFSALALTPSLYVCVYVGFFFIDWILWEFLVVSAAFLTPRWENEAGRTTNRDWVRRTEERLGWHLKWLFSSLPFRAKW